MRFGDAEEPERGNWLRLKEGKTKVRLVSECEPIGKHWNQKTKKSKICIGKDKGCLECQSDNKPKVQWVVWVIDRTDNNTKLATFGWQIVEQLKQLAMNEEYAFDVIPEYDITITKTGEGLETEYSIIADRKNIPLTEEETMNIEALKSVEKIVHEMKEKAGYVEEAF